MIAIYDKVIYFVVVLLRCNSYPTVYLPKQRFDGVIKPANKERQ